MIDNYEMIEKIRRRTGMGLGGIYFISVISALLADDKYHYIDKIPLPFYVILISFLLSSAFYAFFIVEIKDASSKLSLLAAILKEALIKSRIKSVNIKGAYIEMPCVRCCLLISL